MFQKLHALLKEEFSNEDLQIIACPSMEQVYIEAPYFILSVGLSCDWLLYTLIFFIFPISHVQNHYLFLIPLNTGWLNFELYLILRLLARRGLGCF